MPDAHRSDRRENALWSTAADDVETSLHQAQELIRHAMSTRQRDSHQIKVISGDGGAFHTAIDEMITKAQREILCVFSPQDMSARSRLETLRLLRTAHQRGVQVKALIPAPAQANDAAARAVNGQPSYRHRDLPDQSLVIADGREAAIRTPRRESEAAETLIVSVRPLVQVLRTMLAAALSSSTPLPERYGVHAKLREEPARSILASLSAGEKDDAAARKLGISVRTYRRHVADIMKEIRADSRFQAGARAAELGIIR